MTDNKAVTRAWTRAEAAPARRAAMPVVVLALLGSLTALGQAASLAAALTSCLLRSAAPWGAIAAFGALALLRAALSIGQERAAIVAGTRARGDLRTRTLARVAAAGPALLRQRHSVEIAALLIDRIEALDGYFSRWIPASIVWIAGPAIILAGVALRNFHAALILALCGAAVPVAQAVFGIGAAVASRNQFLALTRLQSRFVDRMRGIATIVLSGAAAHEARALENAADELRVRTMRILRVAFLSSAAIDIAMVVAIVGIVVSQGRVLLGLAGGGRPDAIVLDAALFALVLVPEFFAPLRSLALAYQDRAQAASAAAAMADLPQAEAAIPLPVAHRWRDGLGLTLKDVGFSWDPARGPALSQIDLRLPAGHILVLSGASGSGKSTLIELLLGFVRPDCGQIFFNDVDTATLTAREIAAASAWIGQRPMIFAGTLRENILFARPDASDVELNTAIEHAALGRVVADLPRGLDTLLGESGHGLSGGQAQRVAIARAFLKNAPLLLLDEPTAHLDPQTEGEILASLRRLAQGRTVVLSGHSSATHGFSGHSLELACGRIARMRNVA